MLEEKKYNLVYAGVIKPGLDENKIKSAFVSQLKISQEKVNHLFSGKRVTLKKALSKDKAESLQNKWSAIGAEVSIVPHINVNVDANLEPKLRGKAVFTEKKPVSSNPAINPVIENNVEKTNLTANQQDMNERILKAKAMIAAQKLTLQLTQKKESSAMSRLLIFSGVMIGLLFMLYFYAKSMG